MATVNERYRDFQVLRQVELSRFAEGLSDRVVRTINSSDRALTTLLREGLESLGGGGQRPSVGQVDELDSLLKAVKGLRTVVNDARALAGSELFALASDEVAAQTEAIERAVGLEHFKMESPLASRVRTATTSHPVLGRKLGQWFQRLRRADADRIDAVVRTGFFDGETIEAITKRVMGTRSLGYTDGVAQVTRNAARTIVRTSVTHYSNAAKEEMWRANADILEVIMWISTLDGRTTPLCASRDGQVATVSGAPVPEKFHEEHNPLEPPGARPPAHLNCRSAMSGVINPEGIVGDRPFVMDTRTRGKREVDFRRMAREEGRPIKEIRADWARKRVGAVPAAQKFPEWLGNRPAKFQDEYLGPTRGRLFRRGGLTIDRFIDKTGKRFNLAELKARNPGAFVAAGI